MSEEGNDISNLSAAHKWLLVAALSLGAGGNLMGLQKNGDTTDRYRGAEARADFAIRDARIATVERSIDSFEKQQHLHFEHSAAYTQIVNRIARDLKEIEADIKSHKHYGEK